MRDLVTRAYCHLLADVHFAFVAPAFTLSQCDSEYSRKPPNALSLSRYGQAEEKKRKVRKKVYFCGNEKLI